MKNLHDKQSQILKLLKKNIDDPLTLASLSEEVGITSPGVLYHHLRQLEKKGYLKRNPNNPKDYIVFGTPEKQVVYINKYGTAQCGPNGTILGGDPIDRIPIASSLLRFSSSEAFIVEAKGDSMEPKIKSGDIIIAKKQDYAESNDLVVCVYDERVLIKQYKLVEKRIVLNSLNQKHKLIEVRGELRIEGVVKNIIHYD
ncbi:MAG TPA: S24 family peptidase [Bacteroidia bacterium]|nr:S24 family peptidase [Bacteroidia bacterium]HRH08779.1 S24 family peptidase [Bacteroidia bacterium]